MSIYTRSDGAPDHPILTLQGTDEQQVAGDNFRAIRPTYNHKLNWTAGHSTFELSLSDADSSPCEVLAAAWEEADEQKWKIVPAASLAAVQAPISAEQQQQRMYSIRVRRRDARFGMSLEEGRLALRLILPASPEQAWKVRMLFVNIWAILSSLHPKAYGQETASSNTVSFTSAGTGSHCV